MQVRGEIGQRFPSIEKMHMRGGRPSGSALSLLLLSLLLGERPLPPPPPVPPPLPPTCCSAGQAGAALRPVESFMSSSIEMLEGTVTNWGGREGKDGGCLERIGAQNIGDQWHSDRCDTHPTCLTSARWLRF